MFITLNTLYKENEIQKVLDFVEKVYSYGAYGLIVQDLGMVSLIKKYYPNIRISASTQKMCIRDRNQAVLQSDFF